MSEAFVAGRAVRKGEEMQVPNTSKPSGNSARHILIVDDADDIRLLIRLGISKMLPEVQVSESESGMKAAAVLAGNKVDLVVSDLEMDNGNGFWLHCFMSQYYEEIPLIFFTGNPSQAQRVSHTRKVFSKDDLNGLLKEITEVRVAK